MFLLQIFISYLIFLYALYKKTGNSRKYSKGILALLIFSIVVNVHLGLNYAASYSPQHDGIAISTRDKAAVFSDIDAEKFFLAANPEAVIETTSWFGNLGAVFPKYKAVYKYGKWPLELLKMAVS